MPYKLTGIKFNDGTSITPKRLTVIIGPNSSGKSRALSDLAHELAEPVDAIPLVVSGVTVDMPASLQEVVGPNISRRSDPGAMTESFTMLRYDFVNSHQFTNSRETIGVIENELFAKGNSKEQYKRFRGVFGPGYVAYLGTSQRLNAGSTSASGNPYNRPENLLQWLYSQPVRLETQLDGLLMQNFGVKILLDYSGLTIMALRVGEDFSNIDIDPRISAAALSHYETLDSQGDGLKSFFACAVAVAVLKRAVTLIDEPEAFLHPPQAIALGRLIAASAGEGNQVIVSTHSSDLLRGMLEAKPSHVTLLRIESTTIRRNPRNLHLPPLRETATEIISRQFPVGQRARAFDVTDQGDLRRVRRFRPMAVQHGRAARRARRELGQVNRTVVETTG